MSIRRMLGLHRDREQERFYLLPGMGGKARWRKEKMFLKWSIVAGLLVSAILACLLYYISRQQFGR